MKLESAFTFTLSPSETASSYHCECEIVSTQPGRFEKTAVSRSEAFPSLNRVAAIFDAANSTLPILTKGEHFEPMSRQAQRSAESRWNEGGEERQEWDVPEQVESIEEDSAPCQTGSCVYIGRERDEGSEWEGTTMSLARVWSRSWGKGVQSWDRLCKKRGQIEMSHTGADQSVRTAGEWEG